MALSYRGRTALLVLVCLAAIAYLAWRVAGDGGARTARPPAPAARREAAPRAPASARLELLQVATSTARRPAQTVVRGSWGAGSGEFGRLPARESNPEGPMSLVVDRRGGLVVLDQVNRRVQRFGSDGRHRSSHPIGSETAQDLVLDDDGRMHVLSRHGAGTGVEVFGADGRREGRLSVVGGRVSEGGAITGLFADGGGLYVETENDTLVRVADAQGKQRPLDETIPGRPTRDGRLYLRAGIIDKAAGRAYVQAHRAGAAPPPLAWERPLAFGAPLLHILLLDSDRSGRIYLGVETAHEDPATHALEDVATVVVRLDGAAGKLAGTLALPPTTADPSERFRPLAVGDDGTVYQLLPSSQGLAIVAHRFE